MKKISILLLFVGTLTSLLCAAQTDDASRPQSSTFSKQSPQQSNRTMHGMERTMHGMERTMHGTGLRRDKKVTEQFCKRYGVLKSVKPNAVARARYAARPGQRVGLAATVKNWQYLPKVGDQGSQGSCSAYSSCYYYKTFQEAREHGWERPDPDTNPERIMSPAFIYNMADGGVDYGSYIETVMQLLIDHGCATQSEMPYNQFDYTTWPSSSVWKHAIAYRAETTTTIDLSTDEGITALKQHCANGDIAVVGIELYSNFYTYPSGSKINNNVFYDDSGSYEGGHAVTIIGYDDTKAYDDGTGTTYGAFLVVNSWGTSWGVQDDLNGNGIIEAGYENGGFIWLSYGYVKTRSYQLAYLLTDKTAYSPTTYAVVGLNHSNRSMVAGVYFSTSTAAGAQTFTYFNWDQAMLFPTSSSGASRYCGPGGNHAIDQRIYVDLTDIDTTTAITAKLYQGQNQYGSDNPNGTITYLGIENAAGSALVESTQTPKAWTTYKSTSVFSLVALPAAPTNFAGIALSSTSIVFSWTASTSTNVTGYRLYSSTGMWTEIAQTSWTHTGLTANTSSYITIVKAYNAGGESTAATLARVVFSSANAPTAVGFEDVFTSSITARWSENGNSSTTTYCVQISTDNFSSIVTSNTWSRDVAHTFTDLNEGATYYARVKAKNGNDIATSYTSLGSTCTQRFPVPLPAPPTNVAGVAVSSASIQFSWTASTSVYVTGYRLYSSTGMWTEIAQTSWTQTGLAANTSSYVTMVTAYNDSGESAVAPLASVIFSSANAPTSAAFSDVWKSSVTVSWNANGNSDGTSYTVEISTKSDDFTVAKSSSVATTNVSFTFTSLDEGTTYYARVNALNGNNIATSYTSFGSTVTHTSDIPVPPAPTGFSGVALSSTTIHFSWTDHATNETGYRLYSSTGVWVEIAEVSRTSWTQTGLSANTSSYITIVKAYNVGGESAVATLASVVFSSANAPTAVGFEDVFTSSITARWSENGNSSTTTYCVQISTDNFSSIVTSSTWSGSVAYTFTSLDEGTTYYARVKAKNGNEVETSYTSLGSTVTSRTPTPTPTLPKARITLSPASPLQCGTVSITVHIEPTGIVITTVSLACVYSDSSTKAISLSKQNDHWLGTLTIESITAQGTAHFIFSATDDAHNVGTEILEGETFSVDTEINISSGGVVSNSDGASVTVPSGSFAHNVQIVIATSTTKTSMMNSANNAFTDSRAAQCTAQNLYREIDATIGGHTATPTNAVTISLPYPDVHNSGIVDGTTIAAADLTMAYLDETTQRWVVLDNAHVNTTTKRVSVPTTHFSVYTLLPKGSSIPPSSRFIVYPNPCYLYQYGHVSIDNIADDAAADVELKIYSIDGLCMKTIHKDQMTSRDGRKCATWDGRDENGEKVASGVYVCLVKTEQQKKTAKVAILW